MIDKNEIWYYKGVHKVKVVMDSEGYLIVEALEEFKDEVDCERIMVKIGERRIVPSTVVYKKKHLTPPFKEHSYELQMEKKLKRLVAEEEKQCKE